MNCRNLQKDHKHIDLVATRRLQPIGIHERNCNAPVKARSMKTLDDDKQTFSNPENFKNSDIDCTLKECNRPILQSHSFTNDEYLEKQEQESNHDSIVSNSKNLLNSRTQLERNRYAFDSSPFYKQVKPHITTQKRVRYVHLLEPSNRKAMPKDTMEEPIIYHRKDKERRRNDEEDSIHNNSEKKRAPLSFNPIFHPS